MNLTQGLRRLKFYIIYHPQNKMKLQKRFLRKHNKKDYYKYMINLPPLKVKEAGFKEGEELEIDAKDGKITIQKHKSPFIKSKH